MNDETTRDICDPNRWVLAVEAIANLGDRLQSFWERFRGCFKTKTRDGSGHAWTYLRGLLLMKKGRNFANIDRRVIGPEGDGQNLQQFMSDSPWAAQPPIQQVQQEIASTPGLAQGGVLLLDESAEEKVGEKSAGAGRQHNGRLGKVEMSQVGVFLAYYKASVWTWVDKENAMTRFRLLILPIALTVALLGALAWLLWLAPAPDARAASMSVPCSDDRVTALINTIKAANNNGEADVVTLAEGCTYILDSVYNTTDGPNGLPSITSTITIVGNGSVIRRSDLATKDFRIFHISAEGTLTLQGLTIENGVAEQGGGIFNLGDLRLIGSTVQENEAVGTTRADDSQTDGGSAYGGGIYSLGELTLLNSTVSHNEALGGDGALSTEPITPTGAGGDGYGGGIYAEGVFTFTSSTIYSNTAQGGDGGTYQGGSGSGYLTGSDGGDGSGGGFYYNTTNYYYYGLTITDTQINENTAQGGNGSAIDIDSVTGGGLTGGTGGEGYGGGMYKSQNGYGDAVMEIYATDFLNNTAEGGTGGDVIGGTVDTGYYRQGGDGGSGHAGGIYHISSYFYYEDGGFISGNRAVSGAGGAGPEGNGSSGSDTDSGGIYNSGVSIPGYYNIPGDIVLDSVTVSNNTSDGKAGGLFNHSYADTYIYNSDILSNTAFGGDGGGILNVSDIPSSASELNVEDSSVSFNRSQGDGGGICSAFVNGYYQDNSIVHSTIRGNQAQNGGGIYLEMYYEFYPLSISDSVIDANIAEEDGGGILNDGYLEVDRTKITDNLAKSEGGEKGGLYSGGGLYNTYSGEASLSFVTVAGNETWGDGGGIWNEGSLTVSNSAIYTNTADVDGGGIGNTGYLEMQNSTVSDNLAKGSVGFSGGGLYNTFSGEADLSYVTIAYNETRGDGGGIYDESGDTVNLASTIVAENTALGSDPDISGSFNSGGYNLIGINNGVPGFTSTDISGTLEAPLDPILGPLQYNGGPTWTHALLSDSPALDQIDDGINGCGTDITIDQRGFDRPYPAGGKCDIGAFEVQPPSRCFAQLESNPSLTYSSPNAQAVRDALYDAPEGELIKVAGYCAGVEMDTNQVAEIYQDITVRGGYTLTNWATSDPVANVTTLDAEEEGRVVAITSDAVVTLENLVLTNGYAFYEEEEDGDCYGDGGGVCAYWDSQLTMINMTVISNTAEYYGGGVYAMGDVTLIGGLFQWNFAGESGWGNGGGLAMGGGVSKSSQVSAIGPIGYHLPILSIIDTQFISNTAALDGGGVYAWGEVTLNGGLFQDNEAGASGMWGDGGGLWAMSLVMQDTQFISNTAMNGGGAFISWYAFLTSGLFQGNQSFLQEVIKSIEQGEASPQASIGFSPGYGGGIAVGGGGLFAVNNGISIFGGTLSVTDTQFINNTAVSDGGGASVFGEAILNGALFLNNHSTDGNGGGIAVSGGFGQNGKPTQGEINQASGQIGDGSLYATDTRFIDNTAAWDGGGVYVMSEDPLGIPIPGPNAAIQADGAGDFTVAITSTQFIGNQAANGGGAYVSDISLDGLQNRLVNDLFAHNTASGDGQALYLLDNPLSNAEVLFTTIASPTLGAGSAIYVYTGTVSIIDTLIANYAVGIENEDGVVSQDYNLFDVTNPISGTIASGIHSFTGDPAFVNPLTDDYHLSIASFAINRAMNIPGVTDDLDHAPRPQGSAPDIGAFESPYFTDLAVSKTVSPSNTVLPGTVITYTISFTNLGAPLATNVIITDEVPVELINVTVISSGVNITDTGYLPPYVWQVQDLAHNEGGVITIAGTVNPAITGLTTFTNTAIITTDIVESTTTNNKAAASVTIIHPAIAIAKGPDSQMVLSVGTANFTIVITNTGDAILTNVAVSDALAPGCASTIASLAAGAHTSYTCTQPNVTASFVNTAVVSGTPPVGPNVTSSDTAGVTIQPADLTITKTASESLVLSGTTLVYTLTVTNNGPSNATGVTLVDTLPAGVTFVSGSAGCIVAGNVVTCAIGTLANGASAQRAITIRVNLATSGKITNTATVSASVPDLNQSNNTASVMVNVVPSLIVYENDFEEGEGSGWCYPEHTSTTPNGGRNFLGDLSNETACLVLPDLPEHTLVTVTFDLYVIRSWDGNTYDYPVGLATSMGQDPNLVVGPDQWQLEADGTTILHTTFSNWADQPQAYPAPYPSGVYSARTGTSENNTLGYEWNYVLHDSVYHLTFTFEHMADNLVLEFTALGLQDILDESWGLDNVSVIISAGVLPTFTYTVHLPFVAR